MPWRSIVRRLILQGGFHLSAQISSAFLALLLAFDLWAFTVESASERSQMMLETALSCDSGAMWHLGKVTFIWADKVLREHQTPEGVGLEDGAEVPGTLAARDQRDQGDPQDTDIRSRVWLGSVFGAVPALVLTMRQLIPPFPGLNALL